MAEILLKLYDAWLCPTNRDTCRQKIRYSERNLDRSKSLSFYKYVDLLFMFSLPTASIFGTPVVGTSCLNIYRHNGGTSSNSSDTYSPVSLAFNTVEPESGAGDLPPIIFAHGLSGSKEHWDDIMQTVADATKRKAYALDARNHGDSEWHDEFDFEHNVDDILHFMDTQGIQKAIIVGQGMGGFTGIKTALRAPDRVEKLIIEDASVKMHPKELNDKVALLITLMRTALQVVPNIADESTAKKIILDSIISQIPEQVKSVIKPESLKRIIQLKRGKDGLYSYKANIKFLEKQTLNPLEMMKPVEGVYEGPAFFVYGTLSPVQVGLDEENIRKHFPNAELAGIENATHALHLDFPKEFTEAIIGFILKG